MRDFTLLLYSLCIFHSFLYLRNQLFSNKTPLHPQNVVIKKKREKKKTFVIFVKAINLKMFMI